MYSSAELRRSFINYWTGMGHTTIRAAPLIPPENLGLLFNNSGMCQFAEFFLNGTCPNHNRACNIQPCVRAGGKHNDFDTIGKSPWHFSFFEMLGNWSFNSYGKKEAINWAWEYLHNILRLEKRRIHVTVFTGDMDLDIPFDRESYDIWSKLIDRTNIHLGDRKDNFWMMGEDGPCGPCTEILYDPSVYGMCSQTRDLIELWNIVFIAHRFDNNELWNLPNDMMYVDTGMGLERITAVLQDKKSPYQTDLFDPIIQKINDISDKMYFDQIGRVLDDAIRVVADAARMSVFVINEGIHPEPKGRGSVVRSVIRRADAMGWKHLNQKKPFLHLLQSAVADTLKDEYKLTSPAIGVVIEKEEQAFFNILNESVKMVEKQSKFRMGSSGRLGGKFLFEMHTTHGITPDIIAVVAENTMSRYGSELDMKEYKELMEEHRKKSSSKNEPT